MNVLLPLFLLLISNLALYWVFFGKRRFERKIQEQLFAAEKAKEKEEQSSTETLKEEDGE